MKPLLIFVICLFTAIPLYANTSFGSQGLSWKLVNGTLTISKTGNGTGEMPGFAFGGETTPWYDRKEEITTLIFEEGVTSIGSYAFERHTMLTSVVFTESIKQINAYAFYCCSGLTSVVLPVNLNSIGYRSFYFCTGLTAVTIPAHVTIVWHEGFAGCKNLQEVYAQATIPPVCRDNVFKGIPSDCKLYVTGSSKTAYEVADTWKDFNPILTDETFNEPITSDIKLYPNPVRDGFSVNGTEGGVKFNVFDINGAVVFSGTVNDHDYISVALLPAGIYIVKLETSQGIVTRKLIKQ